MTGLRIAIGVLGLSVMAAAVPASAQQAPEKISFGLAGQSMNATIPKFIDEMGLFRKHGLEINFVVLDNANGAATALISKSVQFALSGPGELVAAQGRGQRPVLIVNSYMGLSGSLVLSKSVADRLKVTAKSPLADRLKALAGLTIASPSATSAFTISYRAAAESVNAKANFTYMAQPAMAAALQSGAIQAYIASAPSWVPPIVDGSGVLLIDGPAGDLPANMRPRSTAVILTMRDTIESSPATVRKVVAAFNDFVDALGKRPNDVKAAVGKVMPNLDARTIDLVFPSEAVAWKAMPLTVDDLQHEINFVKAGAQASGQQLPNIENVTPATLVNQ